VNTVFFISTENSKYIIKFGTANPSLVARESKILEHLDSGGVSVPTVHGDGNIDSVPYFVADYISGSQLEYATEIDISNLLGIATHMGRTLGRIHTVGFPKGQISIKDDEIVSSTSMPWEHFFRDFLSNQATDAKKNYPNLARKAKEMVYWAEISGSNPHFLCPLDLHSRNIIWKNNQVKSIIDFERCYGGIREWGYYVTLYMLCMNHGSIETQKIRSSFEKGYRDITDASIEISPIIRLSAVIREMRAAHIWWDNYEKRKESLSSKLCDIESDIQS
jgi:Ser/Thr protein kinase RdoA (MazF antagonist)